MKDLDAYYLFNLDDDYHELHDMKTTEAGRYTSMMQQLTDFRASIQNSQVNESGCGRASPPRPSPPSPPAPPSSACTFISGAGLNGSNAERIHATSKEACCGLCVAVKACRMATYTSGANLCNMKDTVDPVVHGRSPHSVVCVKPPSESTEE